MKHETHSVSSAESAAVSAPWWTHGHVWLLIAGPVAVIAAGFVTLWLALRTPDPVVAEDYYRRGLEINRQQAADLAADKALMPALQGRNHAATPALPQEQSR